MTQTALTLQQLLPEISPAQCWVNSSTTSTDAVKVTGVSADSRRVSAGDIFVAVGGAQTDGHKFAQEAVAKGAVAVVTESMVDGIDVPQYIADCSATLFARLCMNFEVGPRCPIVCTGITGTNGKTTSSWMLRSILQSAGLKTGLVGTIESDDTCNRHASHMTTPTADLLAAHMRTLMQQGASHSVMEISSHALVQKTLRRYSTVCRCDHKHHSGSFRLPQNTRCLSHREGFCG